MSYLDQPNYTNYQLDQPIICILHINNLEVVFCFLSFFLVLNLNRHKNKENVKKSVFTDQLHCKKILNLKPVTHCKE